MNKKSTPAVTGLTQLRAQAHSVLTAKEAKPSAPKDASEALRVLFDLASSPATAHDALALLHELQVHQVELDLQHEELQRARTDLEASWLNQLQLHNASPSAQLVIDASWHLMECNARAVAYLGTDKGPCIGQSLNAWLDAVDQPRVHAWLSQALSSTRPISLAFVVRQRGSAPCPVVAAACCHPLSHSALVSWIEAPGHGS